MATSIDWPSASVTTVEDLAYTLDGVGNPLTLTTPSRTEVYSYDEMNQLESVCFQSTCPDPEDPQLEYTYDRIGNRVTETRGNGTTSTTTRSCLLYTSRCV